MNSTRILFAFVVAGCSGILAGAQTQTVPWKVRPVSQTKTEAQPTTEAQPSAPANPTPSVPFQKTAPEPEPKQPLPPAVAPGEKPVGPGKPEADGKEPKAATVKETVPLKAPADAPAESKPVLSAPVPPVKTPPGKLQTRYFMLIFGSESVPKRGPRTHTWMTIVKATPRPDVAKPYDPDGDPKKYYDLLAHTISWMPRSLHIRTIKFRAEPGVNLDLHTSIRFTLNACQRVALWGPYEVNPLVAEEVYDKTVKQIALLKSGCVMYKSLDFEGAAAAWCKNCIHAVSDLDGIQRRLAYNEFQHNGWEGSRVTVRYMAAANRIDTEKTHEWVTEALDVDKYCISRQTIKICKPQPCGR